MHSCKRNTTSYHCIGNQGLSFKVHLYAYIVRRTVPQRKESLRNGGSRVIVLGSRLPDL